MLENKFKQKLVSELKDLFPGCMIIHGDANEIQGFPDLLILHEDKWASLEGKKEKNAALQPNQDYYVEKMDNMSFSRFIYPENKEEVLNALQRSFASERPSRVFGGK